VLDGVASYWAGDGMIRQWVRLDFHMLSWIRAGELAICLWALLGCTSTGPARTWAVLDMGWPGHVLFRTWTGLAVTWNGNFEKFKIIQNFRNFKIFNF
jgi:hypothetical protein